MELIKKSEIKGWLLFLIHRCQKANVSDSAVVLAYYILLSIFPLLIILGSVLRMTGINYSHLINSLYLLLPSSIYRYLKPVIYSSLISGSKKQFSLGIVVTFWSASRMIAAFQRTVNLAYGFDRPKAIINRLISFIWMIVIVLIITGMIFFLVFGRMLINFLVRYLHGSSLILKLMEYGQWPTTMVVLYSVICVLYYFIPQIKVKFKYIWQGALLSTVGLLVLSKVFSLYLRYFSSSFSTYRTLGAFIVLMFWLYFWGLLLLLGAVVNATNQEFVNYENN